MPAISLGLIGGGAALAGGLLNQPDGFDAPSVPNLRTAESRPLFFQFLQMGGNIDDLRVERVKRKDMPKGKRKGALRKFRLPDGTIIDRSETMTYGGKRFAMPFGKAKGIFEAQVKKFRDKQQSQITEELQGNYEALFGPDGPQFLKDQVKSIQNQGNIRPQFGPRFEQMMRGAIGAAAPRGTYDTDAVLNQAAAPTALAAEQFFYNAQAQAEAQERTMKLGLSGVPGFGPGIQASAQAYTGPRSFDQIQNNLWQSAGMSLQGGLASAQSKSNADAANFGAMMGLAGGLFGVAGAGINQHSMMQGLKTGGY